MITFTATASVTPTGIPTSMNVSSFASITTVSITDFNYAYLGFVVPLIVISGCIIVYVIKRRYTRAPTVQTNFRITSSPSLSGSRDPVRMLKPNVIHTKVKTAIRFSPTQISINTPALPALTDHTMRHIPSFIKSKQVPLTMRLSNISANNDVAALPALTEHSMHHIPSFIKSKQVPLTVRLSNISANNNIAALPALTEHSMGRTPSFINPVPHVVRMLGQPTKI